MERQGLNPAKPVAYFEYDFSRDGGAVGEIALRGNKLPKGAVVDGGKIHVITPVTSAAAVTVELGIEGTDDVLESTLKAALTQNAIIATEAATTPLLTTTAGAGVTMTIGVAAITAGKLIVALEYFA
jgi:hypothetical protein